MFPSLWRTIKNRLFPKAKQPIDAHHDEQKSHVPIDWCTGALWLIRRDALEEIAGHDEQYFLFMSDIALCRELWNAGWHVHVVPKAKAIHGEARLSAGNPFTMLLKRTGRHHMQDAVRFHYTYWGEPAPPLSPSGQGA